MTPSLIKATCVCDWEVPENVRSRDAVVENNTSEAKDRGVEG